MESSLRNLSIRKNSGVHSEDEGEDKTYVEKNVTRPEAKKSRA